MIKNGTADDVKNGQSKQITFSTSNNFISNVNDNGFDLNIEGFNIKAAKTDAARPLGTALQSGNERELIDLRGLAGQVKADFTVNREAAFNNFVGFYRVADANGGIDTDGNGTVDLTPGQAGYAQAAVRSRVAGIDLTVANQGTANITGKQLAGGGIYAPFIISDSTVDRVLNGQNNEVYFAYLGANPNRVDHIRLLGDNVWGFEDLPGGGDLDYNDVIVKASLSIA